jgi:hypothetical protein
LVTLIGTTQINDQSGRIEDGHLVWVADVHRPRQVAPQHSAPPVTTTRIVTDTLSYPRLWMRTW